MNAITTHEPAMLSFLQRAVSDPTFDTNKFEVVLAAVRQEQAKHAEREFYRAMAEAQSEMEPVRKDATNPHTRSKYAKFEAIDGQLRPIYTKHGFSVSYRTGTPTNPGVIRMICTVAHAGGHSIEAELEAALDNSGTQGRSNKTDVQAVGSTVSYLRRYILNMVFNVALASEDDDGEGSRRQPQPQPPRPARPAPAPINRMSRQEIDDATGGDDIPPWDAPAPDPAKQYVDKLIRSFIACVTIDDYNDIMANPAVGKNLNALREKRPELYEQCERARKAALDRLASDADADADAGQPS